MLGDNHVASNLFVVVKKTNRIVFIYPLFAVESHYVAVEYINVDDVIGCCLDLINKIRWILIVVLWNTLIVIG